MKRPATIFVTKNNSDCGCTLFLACPACHAGTNFPDNCKFSAVVSENQNIFPEKWMCGHDADIAADGKSNILNRIFSQKGWHSGCNLQFIFSKR